LGIEEAAAPPSTFWRNSEETLKGFYWVRISDPMAGGLSLFAAATPLMAKTGLMGMVRQRACGVYPKRTN
jgi:hypothetical protein